MNDNKFENQHLCRLKQHRESLIKSFDNLIEITQKDINKKEKKDNEKDEEEITLKDDKIKTYAEGILKSHQTLSEIIYMIKKIDIDIEQTQKKSNTKSEDKKEKSGDSNLNIHLK